MSEKFRLPEEVLYIISKINGAGYRADIVGGPVRDLIRGVEPSDYDITTDARPEDVKRIFATERVVETGIKHGTVTLVLEGGSYEITTYRVDGEYKDSRHPESVEFTDRLELDLSRRDFTMNAIAYNDTDGLCDVFSGIEDIKAGIIRAVGEPAQRFCEDALRILRGVRFAAVLGYEIEEKTAKAAKECRHLLKNVSVERIYTELYKLLEGKFAYRVISRYKDIISEVLPELVSIELPDEERFLLAPASVRLLSLFYLANPDRCAVTFKNAVTRLHTDSKTRDRGMFALGNVGKFDTDTDVGIRLLMCDMGVDVARECVRLEVLLGIRRESALDTLSSVIAKRPPYRPSDLDINGNDLISLGLHGSDIGAAMRHFLLAVARGELNNDRRSLLSAAFEYVNGLK
ncbi:MAG: hypothetical protein J6Q85_07925 [Clostridia bacterium]|nr:hypothetical protein [Clostridia bacterium]